VREVSPDGQQCLLRGALGEVGVAQDPVRHRMQPIAGGNGQARERLLVSILRTTHQIGLQGPSRWRPIGPGVIRYGCVDAGGDSIFANHADSRVIELSFDLLESWTAWVMAPERAGKQDAFARVEPLILFFEVAEPS
jgi:hypothetical protein